MRPPASSSRSPGGDQPAPGPPDRRAQAHHLPAAPLRRGAARRRLPGRPHRPRRCQWPMGAPRPDLRRVLEPIGPGRRLRRQQLPVRLLRGRRRHRLRIGRRQPRRPQGPPRATRNSRSPRPPPSPGRWFPPAARPASSRWSWAPRPAPPRCRTRGSRPRASPDRSPAAAPCSTWPTPDRSRSRSTANSGSNNPVFVTAAAAAERGAAIAGEFVASFTLGAGQFCTKPGTDLCPARFGDR